MYLNHKNINTLYDLNIKFTLATKSLINLNTYGQYNRYNSIFTTTIFQ
jgi:hypothetical protein